MSLWSRLKRTLAPASPTPAILPAPAEGFAPTSQDTLAAIGELSSVVRNNPDAVEIYLALGNLYRAQGEFERAVHIRQNLIARPGLPSAVTAKAFYELGRDYRRGGFLDRAVTALGQARRLAGPDPVILGEMASLAADIGDWKQAAALYRQLGHAPAEAHFLVRQARELSTAGETTQARRLLHKALEVYPGAVEAWVEFLLQALRPESREAPGEKLREALAAVNPELRIVLTVMLIRHLEVAGRREECDPKLLDDILPILAAESADPLMIYSGARLLAACGRAGEAKLWHERVLELEPGFWPSRLAILGQLRATESLTPEFAAQLDFFLARAAEVKRFLCRVCGLKLSDIFFVCPRCQSWHSVRFRRSLTG